MLNNDQLCLYRCKVPGSGDSWNISIQNNPGSGYLNSVMKLQYPQVINGEYKFDLLSNDSGGDEDFNDLSKNVKTVK
jgi:hypothetical protein